MKIIKLEQLNCVSSMAIEQFLGRAGVAGAVLHLSSCDHPEAILRYDVTSIPATILLSDDGQVLQRVYGYDSSKLQVIVDMYEQQEKGESVTVDHGSEPDLQLPDKVNV